MANEHTAPAASRGASVKKGGMVNKVLIVLIFVMAGVTAYMYTQYSDLKSDPAKESQAEAVRLTEQVGKLMVLPEGEQPTIATVTDVEKLVEQPFFAKAKNGDKVLIFTGAKKAILFDPIANKIIEVAPINIGDSTKAKQVAPKPVAPAPETTTTTTTP